VILAVGERVLKQDARPFVPLVTALGGGVAGTGQEMCGALSGALLLIGALHGRGRAQESDTVAYRLARRYRERFVDAFGDTQCSRLRQSAVHGTGGLGSCATLVAHASGLLLDMLDESGHG
jgi:C_GCAxxG_C_C family probable redox protein